MYILDDNTLLSGNMHALYRCDRDGRNVSLVAEDDRVSFSDYFYADGEALYLLGSEPDAEGRATLYRLDLASGALEPLDKVAGSGVLFGVSGRCVLLDLYNEAENLGCDLSYNLDTGETRTLAAAAPSEEIYPHNPDQQHGVADGVYYLFDFATRTLTGIDPATGETLLTSDPFPADPNGGRGYEDCRPVRVLDGWLELAYSSNDWAQEGDYGIEFSYLVNLETGAVQRKPDLPMQTWKGTPQPPFVLLDLGERLLIVSHIESTAETRFDTAGAPYTTQVEHRRLATIPVEDYLAGVPNYAEVAGWI